jgi:hypothetical protein
MKSSTAVETASTMEAASAAMETTAAMAAALGECRRRRTKNHERKNCNENYRQGLFHFSPSNPTTRDRRAGTNFRRGHLHWQPTYHPILLPFTPSFEGPLPLNRSGKHPACPPIPLLLQKVIRLIINETIIPQGKVNPCHAYRLRLSLM